MIVYLLIEISVAICYNKNEIRLIKMHDNF